MDPVDLRLKNAIQVDEKLPNNFKITSCGFDKCIQKSCEDISWKKRGSKLEGGRGVGIAGGSYIAGGLFYPTKSSAAFIKLHNDGAITLLTGASEIGQGADTILCQIAAKELGLKIEDVKKQLLDLASERLEANVEDLEIRDKKVYVKGCPEIGLSIAEIVSASIQSPEGNPILGNT